MLLLFTTVIQVQVGPELRPTECILYLLLVGLPAAPALPLAPVTVPVT